MKTDEMSRNKPDRPDTARANRRLRLCGTASALIIAVVVLTGNCVSVPTGAYEPAARVRVTTTAVAAPEPGVPSKPDVSPDPDEPRTAVTDPQRLELQMRIVAAAEELLRTQQFVVRGHRYNNDCTGTILAIYAMAGIRLVDLFPRYTGGGVQRLHGIAVDHDLLYHSELPQPGDLIFWDNTYDRAGDKKWNDLLTHVGLVLSVDSSGTVEFIHYDYSKGAVKAWMNLTDPDTHIRSDGVIVNSPMRMRSHRYLNPDEWLSSHLYRELGAMYLIEL